MKLFTYYSHSAQIPSIFNLLFFSFSTACHFELIFLNAAKQQWQQVAHYANLIRSSSLWSPCVFNFIYGLAMYQIKEATGNLKLQEEIDECFR